MKKKLCVFLVLAMMLGLLAGCGQSGNVSQDQGAAQQESAESVSQDQGVAPEESAEDVSATQEKSVEWPTATVALYQPTAGGGTIDASIRVMGTYIQDKTGKPFSYVCTTAGNGAVAFESVRNAAPDGNTILVSHLVFYVKYLFGMYDKNPVEDFNVVCAMPAANPYAILVRSDSPYQTADDLAKAIRENPNTVTCGLELGGTSHMMAGMFAMDAGGAFKFVEAGGTNTKLPALQAGNIDVTFCSITDSRQYVESGELRSLGALTEDGKPDPMYPDWPTLVEMGYPNCKWGVPLIVYAPKDTPEEICQAIFDQFKEACNNPESSAMFDEMNQPTYCLESIEASRAYAQEKLDTLTQVADAIGMLNIIK
ncbi:MAG: tripartite tricarboxylate transporter substrate binding protein [Oscillospiraceae bacterium]|nr:tripartite tricarboxylate transporter substrate binding protein [Oscillospiraceae bacterium]